MGKNIGGKIKKLRHQMRLSQSELARIAGIAQSTLSYIENGKKAPQFDTLSSICKGLGLSVLELLSYDETKSAKKLFEQKYAALWPPQGAAWMKSLPPDAVRELIEFQRYLDVKYSLSSRNNSP